MTNIKFGSTVLLVGAGGYVGNILVRDLLAKGYKVRAIDNFYKGHCDSLISLVSNPNFEFQYGNISNVEHVKKMVDGVDGIINLAAVVGFPACQRDPVLAYSTIVDGTNNLLHCRDKTIPFVNPSTGSVYGAITDICTEDSPLNAVSLYGKFKAEAEHLVTNQPNTVSFRFATGFGLSPNMRVNLLVNDLVNQSVINKCMTIFQADFRRTFIHVKDMSQCLIFGLENLGSLKHKVYNAGSNKLNWTKRELAEYICEKTGAVVNYSEIGKDNDLRDYEVNYDRLNQEYWHCKTTIEEGIDELIKVIPLLQMQSKYQ